jgi:hypothetical protein
MSNTAITVAMEVQGNAAFTTQGGLWKMNSLILPKASVPFDNTWSFSGSNVFKSPLTVIEVEV